MTAVQRRARATARAWTPEQDAEVRRLRASGLLWSAIGEQMGRNGASCRQRITRILGEADPLRGAVVARPQKPEAPPPAAATAAPLRAPMRAGDPISWGAITAGTLLDGEPYP